MEGGQIEGLDNQPEAQADIGALLERLRAVKDHGMVVAPDPTRKVVEALQIHGELTGKLIKSNEELIETNKKMLTSLRVTERLTRSLVGVTVALLVLGMVGIMVSPPWGQLPWWEFLLRLIAVAVLLGLLSFFFSSAMQEYFGKGRLGAKGLRRDG